MKDRRRIKNLSGMGQLILDIKPNRCDSDVYINQKFEMDALLAHVAKKKETNPDVTLFHYFVAATGKLLYARPKLNYFVANRHLYEHTSVVVSFVAKVSFDDHAEEMMILVPIEPTDTVDTISQKVLAKVNGVRTKNSEGKTDKKGANSIIDVVGKFPNVLRVPVVGVLKWMDSKGWLPASIQEDNLYYSSIILSNLGSIHCGAIYHNITDFGTCSSLATMGEIKDEIVMENGEQTTKKLCEFGINFDERVADGYYFAKSVKLLQEYFNHPELLEKEMQEDLHATFEIRSNHKN